MSDRARMASQFYIEDHAVIYGLLLQQAEALNGAEGEKASEKATVLYARERGLRMAMRCVADGQPLTPRNYLNYGEWIDDRQWSSFQPAGIAPFTLDALKCGWNESWKKHGLEKYGQIYCTWIDKELVRAFNPENELLIDGMLTHGADKCIFTFVGADFAGDDDLARENEMRVDLRKRTLKDFLYHTGHILSALRRTYQLELGLPKATAIVDKALDEYEALFGKDKREALVEESMQNYSTI